MNCTATDPSPTPEATRFTEPWRTSPTAKMPGTLVSRRKGSRSSVHPLGRCPSRMKVGTGQNETALVALDDIRQPIRSRQSADKNEHRARRHALHLVGVRTQDRNFFQMRLAMSLRHAGVRPHLNVGRLLDLVDQVLRHGAGERARRAPGSRRVPHTSRSSSPPGRPNSRRLPRRRSRLCRTSASVAPPP